MGSEAPPAEFSTARRPSMAPHNFRPTVTAPGTPLQVHRVVVVAIAFRIGSDTQAACRDLDEPDYFYEISTPLPVEIGSVGTVRLMGWARIRPVWTYTPSSEDRPNGNLQRLR